MKEIKKIWNDIVHKIDLVKDLADTVGVFQNKTEELISSFGFKIDGEDVSSESKTSTKTTSEPSTTTEAPAATEAPTTTDAPSPKPKS